MSHPADAVTRMIQAIHPDVCNHGFEHGVRGSVHEAAGWRILSVPYLSATVPLQTVRRMQLAVAWAVTVAVLALALAAVSTSALVIYEVVRLWASSLRSTTRTWSRCEPTRSSLTRRTICTSLRTTTRTGCRSTIQWIST